MRGMRIELERLVYPEATEELECGLCKRPFTLGVVVARAVFCGNYDGSEVCPECALHLGEGPMGESGKFPGIEDFTERFSEWETPEFASEEERDRALGLWD